MKTSDPLRFGIIGTGGIAGAAHGPALKQVDGVTLWSILSRDTTRAAEFARLHGAAAPRAAYDKLEEFLADPLLQAVIIASPDNLHAAHILACARAGKHVLVEKPMVVTHEEGVEVIEACRAHGVRLGVAFHSRWHAGHRKLHQMITRDKILGPLRHMRVQWTWRAQDASNWRARADLGSWWSLAGTGAHCFDLVHWLADTPGRSVADKRSLIGREVWNGPHDETAIVLFRYSDGLTAECTTSVLFDSPSRLEIYGADGFAICEGTLGRLGTGTISVNGVPLAFDPVIPFEGEIRDFAAAIRENREPEVSGPGGLLVVDDMIRATAEG